MRILAYSIVILAGSVMASVGAYVDALPDGKRWTFVDEWGLALIGFGALLMLKETFGWSPTHEVERQHRATHFAAPQSAK